LNNGTEPNGLRQEQIELRVLHEGASLFPAQEVCIAAKVDMADVPGGRPLTAKGIAERVGADHEACVPVTAMVHPKSI
jgi:hypothetical protein